MVCVHLIARRLRWSTVDGTITPRASPWSRKERENGRDKHHGLRRVNRETNYAFIMEILIFNRRGPRILIFGLVPSGESVIRLPSAINGRRNSRGKWFFVVIIFFIYSEFPPKTAPNPFHRRVATRKRARLRPPKKKSCPGRLIELQIYIIFIAKIAPGDHPLIA